MGYGPVYTHSTSSINTNTVTEYWTHNINMNFNYFMLKGWVFSTNIDAKYWQKLSPSDNKTSRFIWNASVEKKIVPKKDISLIASINDILNQRIGFNQSSTSNFITENIYSTVQRYAMLSLRWKFNKNKKSSEN